MDIQNSESTVSECVDHVSGLFVNLDLVDGPQSPGELNSIGISRNFSGPSKFDLEFMYD